MSKRLIATALGLMACVSMVGATTVTTDKSTQQQCEQEYAQQLKDYANRNAVVTQAPHCKAMTDSQWMQINKQTESLRLQAIR